MSPRTPALGLLAGVALLLAAPAGASAVTGTVLGSCHTNVVSGGTDEPIEVELAGGTPGAAFTLRAALPGRPSGSTGTATGTYDASGDATARITTLAGLGRSPSAGRVLDLVVREGSGPEVAIGQTLVTNYALSVAASPRSPRSRRLIRVSGTPLADQRLYGFVVRRGSTRVLRRIALGVADECGALRSRVVVAPRGGVRGAYRLYVGPGKTLRRSAATTLVQGFSIRRG